MRTVSLRIEIALVDMSSWLHTLQRSNCRALSLHLIHRFSDVSLPSADGLVVELQLRTWLQHAWATALETVDSFQRTSLKSSAGPKEWQDFFSLSGAGLALHEGCAAVHERYAGRSKAELFAETVDEMDRLWVRQKLKSYAAVLERISGAGAEGASYYLLELDLEKSEAKFQAYSTADLEAANSDYLAAEKRLRDSPAQVVLVAAESVEAMRQAYPNYFMDTEHFVALLGEIEAAAG